MGILSIQRLANASETLWGKGMDKSGGVYEVAAPIEPWCLRGSLSRCCPSPDRRREPRGLFRLPGKILTDVSIMSTDAGRSGCLEVRQGAGAVMASVDSCKAELASLQTAAGKAGLSNREKRALYKQV